MILSFQCFLWWNYWKDKKKPTWIYSAHRAEMTDKHHTCIDAHRLKIQADIYTQTFEIRLMNGKSHR